MKYSNSSETRISDGGLGEFESDAPGFDLVSEELGGLGRSVRIEDSCKTVGKVAFVGNYIPRSCGIATFTADLCEAVSRADPEAECFVVAMDDRCEGYAYPSRVRFELEANRREQYDLAADFVNIATADVVSLQHEYGIFGGKAGEHLLPMLRQVRAPVVTTLHTVLSEPNDDQRRVMLELGRLSDRMVVMNDRAVEYLQQIYEVPESKIRMIHHGIPDLPFVDPNFYKDKFDAEDRKVVLTFGLLSPGKGIEYMIDALPDVVRRFPDILYIVLGATHPHSIAESGDAYRMTLESRVRHLELQGHVTFINRFVELEALCEYLGAADIYVSPYLNPQQIVSGALAYAMGAGKAVVSTPYLYAEDMLADGRGRLVPFRDSNALARTLLDLLENDGERHAMRKRAYRFARSMTWAQVAERYVATFAEAIEERTRIPRNLAAGSRARQRVGSLPELNPRHLLTMTDSVGIMQHARYSVPNPNHGYSTDDQARALMVAVKAGLLRPMAADWDQLEARYLSFLLCAFDPVTCRFDNFMTYARQWTKPLATEDVHARAVWALAHVVAFSRNEGHRNMAAQLLEEAVPPTLMFTSPRGCTFTILAIQVYLRHFGGASAFRKERDELAYRLLEQFEKNARDDWPWLEDRLTYANARLPHALIEVGDWLSDDRMIQRGLKTLSWLDQVQTSEQGHFVPVGTNGWYPRGGPKARFDQQPIEAYSMLDACLSAHRVTGKVEWLKAGTRAFDWFLGINDLGVPVCDFRNGGCFDGLHADRVNQNQGAESTVVWLLSLMLMHEVRGEINPELKKEFQTTIRQDHEFNEVLSRAHQDPSRV